MTSKTAQVIWSNGTLAILPVIAETATTFTTGDVNKTRWHKGHDGGRVGAFRYIPKSLRLDGYPDQATAKIIN